MHQRLLAILAFSLFAFSLSAQKYLDMIEAGTYPITAIQQEAEAYFNIVGRERGSGYKPFKRWEYVAQMELDDAGVKISNFELSKRARDYRRAEKVRQQAEFSGFGGDWKQLGPTYKNATSSWNPGVGRITSLGIDASNTNHLIVGSPTGGVWKSLDGGNNWAPLTDNYSTVDVYCLEISPYNNNQYLWGSTSGKIFRSIDGGASWVGTGNVTGTGRVSRIQYHPTDPNIVYAVSETNGLFRSVNSGSTWTAVAGVNGVVGYDVEFKPGDPNTLYFSGKDVYRSTNGGTSFTQINGFGTANNNYKMMGVSAANPNFVYVLEASGGKFGAFYKSTDSGVSFTKLVDGADINYFGYSSTGDDDKGQAPRDMDIAVSPFNANEVHIAGTHTWKSINGGNSFNLTSHWIPSTAASLGVGYSHADIDLLKFAGNTLYVTSDGGIYTSTDGAASFVDRTSGIGIREFYKIGVSKTNPNVVSGGAQDNGSSVMRGANRQWVDWLGADGMETFVDWNNANNLYGTSQNGSMYRSSNQGTSQTSISKPPNVDDGAWVTPFEQDPQVANTIYVAFADVWKTSNNGGTWTKISNFDSGNMSQMKLAPTDNQRIYVSRGSSLFTTANGGTTWTTITTAWGSASISYIAVHPLDPQRVLIVTASAVFQSTNAGTSWTNITAGLPSGTKYCATWENTGKNGIYVGGFGYVSYTNDDLPGQWVGFFDGMPNCRVYELEINYVSNTIFAGTYGRGLWESPIYKAIAPVAAFSAENRMGCGEMTVAFTDNSTNTPTAWEWTFDGGIPASSTLQNPVVTFSSVGNHTVTLKSTNHVGENTVTLTDYITIIGPSAPTVADVVRCDPGEVSLTATGLPGEEINWYAQVSDTVPAFTGDVFTSNIAQTTTYYATSSTPYLLSQRVGPKDNTIGTGGNHAGIFFLIFDAERPFRLKSATVYANGTGFRTFQLRDANANVLLEKTIMVNDGQNRITLDMNIPQGTDLQIGCISPANLYRNNAGVTYPYSIDGLVKIKSSTGGSGFYYFLYDLAVESTERCESGRVAVTGTVSSAPDAPVVAAGTNTTLCPGESVMLTAENSCPGCTVNWSTGEVGASIMASAGGNYTATLTNGCGDSPVSNAIAVTTASLPGAPNLSAAGATALCPGEEVMLLADNICPGCTIQWSTGETEQNITVSTIGTYTATLSNMCGEGPISNPVEVVPGTAPDAVTVTTSGPTALCPGESVELVATTACLNCTVNWSNGETGANISVTAEGIYTATVGNGCGASPASNPILVLSETVPDATTILADGPTGFCTGGSVLLTAENLCPDCTVHWSTGETGVSITVATGGIYTATLQNACGDGPASNTIPVSVGTPPDAPVLSASGATVLCNDESVLLSTNMVCADCTVTWSNGETGSSITVSTADSYTATFSNICGDSPASNTITVSMGTAPEAPILSANGPTMLCSGESVVLTVANLCTDCIVTWSTGETSPEITVSTDGWYVATFSHPCGDSPVSNGISIITGSVPEAPSISAPGDTVLCPGESVVLLADKVCPDCIIHWSNGDTGPSITVSAAGSYTATVSHTVNPFCGESPASNTIVLTDHPPFVPMVQVENTCHLTAPIGSNYQWFLNGVEIPGATGQFLTATEEGQYIVSMSDAAGCTGISVQVLAEACVSGTLELEGLASVRVYPNPAKDRIFLDIQSLQALNVQFELFSADGRFVGRLFQGEIVAGGQVLEMVLPELAAGMYQYRLKGDLGGVNGVLIIGW